MGTASPMWGFTAYFRKIGFVKQIDYTITHHQMVSPASFSTGNAPRTFFSSHQPMKGKQDGIADTPTD